MKRWSPNVTESTSSPISPRSNAGFWSSSRTFFLPVGPRFETDRVTGYPIDMRVKAYSADWPRPEMIGPGALHVGVTQYALGCFEHWLAGGEQRWLDACVAAADELIPQQQADGSWLHDTDFPHTFPLRAPWASGITQGQAASLFVRLHLETGKPGYQEAARLALRPLTTPQADGGLCGELGGRPWPEEYPTQPQSHVLNGAIFALWGAHDVALGLGDSDAQRQWNAGVDSLAANLHRYDTGYWSFYSLFPHPVRNRASSFYHGLHVNQLQVMEQLAPRPVFEQTRTRWEAYANSRVCSVRAFAWKTAFRLLVPRNRLLSRRMPWTRMPARQPARTSVGKRPGSA